MDNGESHDGMWQSWQHLMCPTGHTVGCGIERSGCPGLYHNAVCVSLYLMLGVCGQTMTEALFWQKRIRKSIIHCVIFMHVHITW